MIPNVEGNFRLVAMKDGRAYDGVTVMARPCMGCTFATLVINNAQGKTVTLNIGLVPPDQTFNVEKAALSHSR